VANGLRLGCGRGVDREVSHGVGGGPSVGGQYRGEVYDFSGKFFRQMNSPGGSMPITCCGSATTLFTAPNRTRCGPGPWRDVVVFANNPPAGVNVFAYPQLVALGGRVSGGPRTVDKPRVDERPQGRDVRGVDRCRYPHYREPQYDWVPFRPRMVAAAPVIGNPRCLGQWICVLRYRVVWDSRGPEGGGGSRRGRAVRAWSSCRLHRSTVRGS
jgi:hypothetical protein